MSSFPFVSILKVETKKSSINCHLFKKKVSFKNYIENLTKDKITFILKFKISPV